MSRRIAIIAESFLLQVNGVSRSVRMVAEQLTARGHTVGIIAPGPGPDHHGPIPVVRLPAVPLPLCRDFPLGIPGPALRRALTDLAPDVVHLASPALVGARGAVIAHDLGLPTVAVYQTDLAGFATQYHLGAAATPLWRYLRRVHAHADRTLAPSRAAVADLRANGFTGVHRWGRGVDTDAFAPAHRVRPATDRVRRVRIGYVGRLAAEKRLELLRGLIGLPGTELVIVGDGPERARLERRLRGARFTGRLDAGALSQAYADLDVFVHPGRHETFCQAAQEALASGVPVVAAAAGGLLDLVEPGRNGLLFDPDEPDQLVRAVERLVHDTTGRHRASLAARADVAPRSWRVVVDELEAHYDAVRRPQVIRAAA